MKCIGLEPACADTETYLQTYEETARDYEQQSYRSDREYKGWFMPLLFAQTCNKFSHYAAQITYKSIILVSKISLFLWTGSLNVMFCCFSFCLLIKLHMY